MSLILIQKNAGFTLDNLPEGVLSVASGIDVVPNGDIIVSVMDNERNRFARSAIFSANQRIQFIVEGPDSYICHQNPAMLFRAAVQNQVQAAPTQAPAPVIQPVQNHVWGQLAQGITEEEIEEEEDESRLIPVVGYRPPAELIGDFAIAEIAKCLRNNLSSNASMIASKLNELDKIMKRSFILRNEIELFMKPVIENEKIRSIQAQIETINSSGGDIKKAYITNDGYLVILTNHLRSFPVQSEGHPTVFDIGEMQITISMAMLLAQTEPGTVNALKIKNLTHEYVEDDTRWQCGHARNDMVCLGGVFNQVYQALVEKNIILAVECILRFIKNPDPTDAWGCKILHFPIIAEEANA